MPRIISVHEYTLKPGVGDQDYEAAVEQARERGLFLLPGLVEIHFVKGIRGARRGEYAFIWVYESREAWEQLWGPEDEPSSKEDYPESWKTWENDVLAPFLDRDPDQIEFTTYEMIHSAGAQHPPHQ